MRAALQTTIPRAGVGRGRRGRAAGACVCETDLFVVLTSSLIFVCLLWHFEFGACRRGIQARSANGPTAAAGAGHTRRLREWPSCARPSPGPGTACVACAGAGRSPRERSPAPRRARVWRSFELPSLKLPPTCAPRAAARPPRAAWPRANTLGMPPRTLCCPVIGLATNLCSCRAPPPASCASTDQQHGQDSQVRPETRRGRSPPRALRLPVHACHRGHVCAQLPTRGVHASDGVGARNGAPGGQLPRKSASSRPWTGHLHVLPGRSRPRPLARAF